MDIEILLDVSYSMMAEDLAPNRLAVAKEVIHNFVSEQVSNRVGLVVFSGRPFSSLPLTFDYKIIEKIVSRISTDIINQERTNLQGTAIGDAMMLGMDNLEKKDTEENATREKVMILMTDGEANK
ncbi:MAG: VWA domain-containing protein [Candidatus Peribacteria bacterium]|nr:MAG: VWA domain-containing protein [Candidatus Peribacteria bacterium]